jgi:hypothetical protein
VREFDGGEKNPVYCGGCGAAIDSSAKFCRSCGADQAQFLEQPPLASPPQESSPGVSGSNWQPESPVQPDPVSVFPVPPGRSSVLTSPWRTAAGHRRSVAWIYYALIGVGGLIISLHHPAFLLVAIVAGLYSTYLFRGGRFVIWFW